MLRRFRPVDIATLTYISIQILVTLIFISGNPRFFYFPMFYLAASGIALIFALYDAPISNYVWRVFRISYPFFLFLFFYEAVGPQVFSIFKRPFDGQIVAFENIFFGIDPAVALQRYMSINLNELMNFGYILYYFFIPAGLILLVAKKRIVALERMTLATCLAFYASYLIFILYPVVGPRFYLADFYYLPMIGPFFTKLAAFFVGRGGLYGGAMPSSHCAVVLVVTWFLSTEFRKLSPIWITVLALVCAATIYGRYHYVSDVAAGLLVGALAIFFAKKWMKNFVAESGSDLRSGDGGDSFLEENKEIETLGTKGGNA